MSLEVNIEKKLDGFTLRAAFPPETPPLPCWARPAAAKA